VFLIFAHPNTEWIEEEEWEANRRMAEAASSHVEEGELGCML
jgi:hypothetical protein